MTHPFHQHPGNQDTSSGLHHQTVLKDVEQIKIANFIVQENIKGSTFELDKINNISKVKWSGNVDLATAAKLLTLGGDSVEHQGFTKLCVDRFELKEFDTAARVWIKEMLKTRAKRLAKKVEKLAIINAESSMGGIFSNMLTSSISLLMPGLTIKKFDDREEAINWLLE
ncbi:MAG: STAS/SEC14 domain-containing protein [Cyclobacteriaceae bacterium]